MIPSERPHLVELGIGEDGLGEVHVFRDRQGEVRAGEVGLLQDDGGRIAGVVTRDRKGRH